MRITAVKTREDVERLLKFAKDRFLARDCFLLAIEVNERSLTHKFAEYMQVYIGDLWDVDCEYNRFGTDPKLIILEIKRILDKEIVPIEDRTATTAYPDIIVHKRGAEEPNLLVIEAKKNPTAIERAQDKQKLGILRRMYHYAFTVFLKFDTQNQSITWEIEE